MDDKFRDPAQAILDGLNACELTAYHSPRNLDTLAAAHAAGRDLPAAVKRQQQALDLAPTANRPAYRSRLELYQANQSFRAAPRFGEPAESPVQP